MQKDASFDGLSGSFGEKVLQMDKSEQGCGNLDAAAQVTPRSSDGLPASGEDLMPGPGSQLYDPLTNYLSPRPRFLRYDPKRLREIYLRRETEQAVDAEFDSPTSDEVENPRSERCASPSPLRPSLEQEECFESDASRDWDSCESLVGEDEGTAEDEEPSSCSPIWKILLLLGILFSAAEYMCSSQSLSTRTFTKRLQIVKERNLKVQDAPKMISGNTGVNLDNHTRAAMSVCSYAHFDALATANSGVGSGKLLNFCETAEGGKLQEEDHPGVTDIDDQEEEYEELISVEEKIQNNCFVAGYAEHPIDEKPQQGVEMMMMTTTDDDNQIVDNENLDVDLTVLRDENEPNNRADLEQEKKNIDTIVLGDENEQNNSTDLEQENENIVGAAVLGDENEQDGRADLEQEKKNIVGAFIEEHSVDITMKTETGAMSDPKKPAESPQARAADHGGEATFISYGMKALSAALLTVLAAAAAAACTSFRSRRPRGVETPSVGPAAERGVTLPSTEELKKSFDSLGAGDFKTHGSRPPAAELLVKGSIVGSFAGNRESKMSYETRPPSVELLGEFSVAEVAAGFREDGRPRAAATGGKPRRSEPSGMPTGSGPASLERSPSGFSTTESTQEKTARKQSNRHKREAEEAGPGSTPLRRSSRLRNRVATP